MKTKIINKDSPVGDIKGVGGITVESLKKIEIITVEDLAGTSLKTLLDAGFTEGKSIKIIQMARNLSVDKKKDYKFLEYWNDPDTADFGEQASVYINGFNDRPFSTNAHHTYMNGVRGLAMKYFNVTSQDDVNQGQDITKTFYITFGKNREGKLIVIFEHYKQSISIQFWEVK